MFSYLVDIVPPEINNLSQALIHVITYTYMVDTCILHINFDSKHRRASYVYDQPKIIDLKNTPCVLLVRFREFGIKYQLSSK